MHTLVTNLQSLGKVTLFGVLFGAGLPLLFALGIRSWSAGTTLIAAPDGSVSARRSPASTALAYTLFAAVGLITVVAILYIAKAFIAHNFHIYLFGLHP